MAVNAWGRSRKTTKRHAPITPGKSSHGGLCGAPTYTPPITDDARYVVKSANAYPRLVSALRAARQGLIDAYGQNSECAAACARALLEVGESPELSEPALCGVTFYSKDHQFATSTCGRNRGHVGAHSWYQDCWACAGTAGGHTRDCHIYPPGR